jgi:hypothetical protein
VTLLRDEVQQRLAAASKDVARRVEELNAK